MNRWNRMPHRLGTAVILAVVGVAAAGCTVTAVQNEATPTEMGLLSSVDTMFGTIEVPKPGDGELRVVALGWSDAETALALGVKPVAVYDWLEFGEDNKGVGPWATDLFGDETPVIMKNIDQSINYEQIQSLEPDLILNVNSSGDQAQFERLNSIAPTIYAPQGANPYGTGWRVETTTVAQALGLEERGDELVTKVEDAIADAKAAHPEFDGRTAVAGIKGGDSYAAYLPGDPRWDLLASLGFTQSAAIPALGPQATFYATIPAEKINALDADVTILFPIGYTLDQLENDPLVQSLTAVKDGRAIFLDPAGEITTAFSVGSVLSLPVALEQLLPSLAEASEKVK